MLWKWINKAITSFTQLAYMFSYIFNLRESPWLDFEPPQLDALGEFANPDFSYSNWPNPNWWKNNLVKKVYSFLNPNFQPIRFDNWQRFDIWAFVLEISLSLSTFSSRFSFGDELHQLRFNRWLLPYPYRIRPSVETAPSGRWKISTASDWPSRWNRPWNFRSTLWPSHRNRLVCHHERPLACTHLIPPQKKDPIRKTVGWPNSTCLNLVYFW